MKIEKYSAGILLAIYFSAAIACAHPAMAQGQSLRELNSQYLHYAQRLKEISPLSEEAKRIRPYLAELEKQIKEEIEKEKKEHGPAWRDRYRESSGQLPGGFIEDARSELAKAKERLTEQEGKVKSLEQKIEELKKEARPIEPLQGFRDAAMRRFREDYFKKYGRPEDAPTPEEREKRRRAYMDAYNAEADRVTREWKKKQSEIDGNNRELGRTIKELSEEKAALVEMNKEIARLTRKAAAEAEQLASQEDAWEKERKKQGSVQKEKPAGAGELRCQVTLGQARVLPGEKVTATYEYEGAKQKESSYITLVDVSLPLNKYSLIYAYLKGKTKGSVDLFSQRPGTFEARIFSGGSDYVCRSSNQVTVEDVTQGVLLRPLQVGPRGQLVCSYAGLPGHPKDWWTLVKVSEPASKYDFRWNYLRGSKKGFIDIVAHDEPGEYEVRIYRNMNEATKNYEIVARSNPIKVVAEEEPPAETDAMIEGMSLVKPEPPHDPFGIMEVTGPFSFRVKVVFNKDPGVDSEEITVKNPAGTDMITAEAKRTRDPRVFLTEPITVSPDCQPQGGR